MNKVISESHSFDEQLLEGLPIDDFGGKLFWEKYTIKWKKLIMQ